MYLVPVQLMFYLILYFKPALAIN